NIIAFLIEVPHLPRHLHLPTVFLIAFKVLHRLRVKLPPNTIRR
ncbi:hypothetical protein ACN38_g13112, partial [Penicillium nordicum]